MPDVKLDPAYVSRFAYMLYTMGYMEDWVDEYTRKHGDMDVDVRSYGLTDEEYADFCRFIESRDVPYESESRRALTELKRRRRRIDTRRCSKVLSRLWMP